MRREVTEKIETNIINVMRNRVVFAIEQTLCIVFDIW
jgi:hypothetical protein